MKTFGDLEQGDSIFIVTQDEIKECKLQATGDYITRIVYFTDLGELFIEPEDRKKYYTYDEEVGIMVSDKELIDFIKLAS